MFPRRSRWLGALGLLLGAAHTGCPSGDPFPGDLWPSIGDTGSTTNTGGTGGTAGSGGSAGTGGATGTTTTMTGPPGMCDPSSQGMANGPVDEGCGVFVSSSMGDDDASGAGSRSKPFKTIAKALEGAGVKRVYLCAEDFVEPVTVNAEVTLYGGLDCTMPDWLWIGATTKTRIAPNAGEVPLTVDSAGKLQVEDVAFESMAAPAAGSSSIAIIADMDAELTLTRCDVKAGDAKDGATPMPEEPAPSGDKGKDGGAACSATTVFGAGSTNNLCDPADVMDNSVGGAGGNGDVVVGGAGLSGTPIDMGNGAMMNGGTGATTDADGKDLNCTLGGGGKDGPNGAAGAGGTELGTLSKAGYLGAGGAAGAKGRPGQGGGGGGGSKGEQVKNLCADGEKLGGASGGGGGAGGCGGKGGEGGQAGGSSMGIVSLGATLKLAGVSILTGKGGNGGNGAAGQEGGGGGVGGKGGAGIPGVGMNKLYDGCAGGKGGKGGTGGAGGGGRGGHSIGIAYTGNAPVIRGDTTITLGSPGNGGMGGNNGVGGIEAQTQPFPASP